MVQLQRQPVPEQRRAQGWQGRESKGTAGTGTGRRTLPPLSPKHPKNPMCRLREAGRKLPSGERAGGDFTG